MNHRLTMNEQKMNNNTRLALGRRGQFSLGPSGLCGRAALIKGAAARLT
jgi:hypothetical protein